MSERGAAHVCPLAEFGEETLNDDEVTIISSVLECVLPRWRNKRRN